MQILFTIVGVIALVIFAGLLFSLPVWILWNYCLVGAITGVNEIGWLQAWGISILCGFLFKANVEKK